MSPYPQTARSPSADPVAASLAAPFFAPVVYRDVPIRPLSDGGFYMSENAPHCTVLAALTDTGEYWDSVAWQPARPDRWRRALGVAPLLGLIEVIRARECEIPILLVETPAAWLASEHWPCACVLDWRTNLDLWFGDVEIVAPGLEDTVGRWFRAAPRFRGARRARRQR
jgi:hypothetical protein